MKYLFLAWSGSTDEVWIFLFFVGLLALILGSRATYHLWEERRKNKREREEVV